MLATESLPERTVSSPPDALGLSTAHISPRLDDLPPHVKGNPYLQTSKNGNFSLIKISSGRKPRSGGGLRGEITEFTSASRRRMQLLLNSVNHLKAAVPVLITLTYHEVWSEDPAVWKDQLDAFRKRLERKYGQFSAIWRLEYQRRGAPHFHLMCFFWRHQGRKGLLPSLRMDVGEMWWEVTGRTSEAHLEAGTRCEEPRSWAGARSYLSKYMAKHEKLNPGARSPGRFWGVWRKALLPILYITTSITFHQAVHARRLLRRLSGIKARRFDLSKFSCFVSYSTTLKLLAWLARSAHSAPGPGRLPPRTAPAGPPRW